MSDVTQGDTLLVVFNPSTLEIYKDGLAAEIEKIATEAKARVGGVDVTTDDGRQVIRSTAYKVARSKTALDDLGAKMLEEQKATVRAVDASRKKMRDQLDLIRDEVRKPLTEYEEREKKRVAEHEAGIKEVEELAYVSFATKSADIQARLDKLNHSPVREWGEYFERYAAARLTTSMRLEELLQTALDAEAQQAELARLRAEAAERDRQAAEERVAREAADVATRKAEAAAQLKIAQERQEREKAEERARAAEEQAKLALEREKAAARAAEERAEAEEAARARAVAEERERKAKRAERMGLVNAEIEAAFIGWFQNLGEEGEQTLDASAAVGLRRLIADGKVPHVSIDYY